MQEALPALAPPEVGDTDNITAADSTTAGRQQGQSEERPAGSDASRPVSASQVGDTRTK